MFLLNIDDCAPQHWGMLQDTRLQAVSGMITTMAGIVDSYILHPRNGVSPEAMHTISGLYQQKAIGEFAFPAAIFPAKHR